MPFQRPTAAGKPCKLGTPGCRPKPQAEGESDESYAKRSANYNRSFERRGGVKFYEMNTEQRKAFLKAGGKKERMTEAIQKYQKNHKGSTTPPSTPPGNGPGKTEPPKDKGGNYFSSGTGLSRLSPEARKTFLAKKRARMTAAKGPLGGK